MKVAVIPARGGSKRIPKKNIKEFSGRPMISWSITVAIATGLFDKIIVSTDDEEICKISNQYGADTPFVRPESLSGDFSGVTDVMQHAACWMHEQGWGVESLCCILATAPFINKNDISLGYNTLKSGNYDHVIAVTEYASSIFRSFEKSDAGGLRMFFPQYFLTRSQDLPTAMHDAAQFYWGKSSAWMENLEVFNGNTGTLEIPRWRVQDIDTEEDWGRAELMAKYINMVVD